MSLSWHKIKRSRRVIIHLPSLGYAQRVRDTIGDFETIQNAQMARLCDVRGQSFFCTMSSLKIRSQ